MGQEKPVVSENVQPAGSGPTRSTAGNEVQNMTAAEQNHALNSMRTTGNPNLVDHLLSGQGSLSDILGQHANQEHAQAGAIADQFFSGPPGANGDAAAAKAPSDLAPRTSDQLPTRPTDVAKPTDSAVRPQTGFDDIAKSGSSLANDGTLSTDQQQQLFDKMRGLDQNGINNLEKQMNAQLKEANSPYQINLSQLPDAAGNVGNQYAMVTDRTGIKNAYAETVTPARGGSTAPAAAN